MTAKQTLCEAASGRILADTVFKNGNIINVFTREIYTADVAVYQGMIAGIGTYHGSNEIDCSGKYLCPGLMDAHLHIESSMVTPCEMTKSVLPDGTTTLIADPHEMVNVCGSMAIDYLLEAAAKLPVNLFVMLPSSVPATPFETNGANFDPADINAYINHPRVLGLGEVMCFPQVLSGDSTIFEKLDLAADKTADGHAPGLSQQEIQTYACAGIATDHECVQFEEALEKCRAGMKILIREGSAAKNMDGIIPGLVKSGLPLEHFLLCTDDKHLEDIWKEGHISHCVRKCIALGVKPAAAIAMASIHTARTYGLTGYGAIAPGYHADLLILDDLETFTVASVYKDGHLVTSQWMEQLEETEIPENLLHTVHFQEITPSQLALPCKGDMHVIEMVPHQILTRNVTEPLPSRDGYFAPQGAYTKLCVVERHRGTGNIATAPLKGFGIKNGAIATTVAHDSHNIIAAGDNDEDLCTAINYLKEIQGGYVIASRGKVQASLPLPLFGLMSTASGKVTSEITSEMLKLAHEMGIPQYFDPFITLSFMALPVIPEIRLTDRGLFDSTAQKFIV